MIHSVLLIGQSNMAGRGRIADAPSYDTSRMLVLRNGRWMNCFRPVNPDRPFSGYNLAETFADDYLKDHEGVKLGLIPCADGGTTLDQWKEGSLLFDNAIYQARLAMRTSHLVAILWHQGESDSNERVAPVYRQRLEEMIAAFRREPGFDGIPFLVGGLSPDLADWRDGQLVPWQYAPMVTRQLREAAEAGTNLGFVPADGLTNDHLHFDTAGLIGFGHRYYEVFRTMEDRNRVFGEKPEADAAIRSAMELL